jgi:hypothetical protein
MGLSYLGYYVEPTGFIQLQGTIIAVGSAGSDLFRLPPGHRPFAALYFSVPRLGGASGSSAWVAVYASGYVVAPGPNPGTNGTAYDLSAIRFRIGG